MKKRLIFVILACMVISLSCMGCAQEKGFIMRNDITYKDLAFVFDGTEANGNVTIDDMFSALGLPTGRSTPEDANINIKKYWYHFDDEVFEGGVIEFVFDENGQILAVDTSPFVENREQLVGPVKINRSKYMMVLRDDITEDELDAIDMESTSVDVQQLLGAPHDRIYTAKVGLRTDAYTYPLTNGNTFIISYERNGVIVKAWVADENKETQKVYVDRTDEFGVWLDFPHTDPDDVEYN